MTHSAEKAINVLFLGGGKRVSLAQRFIEAGENLNRRVNIFSYELNQYQPISLVGRIIEGKRWDDPDATAHVLETLFKNDIDLLVTNVDPALKIHSTLIEMHPSAKFCSRRAQIEACYSKNRFQSECKILGLPVIPSWDGKSFPMIAKPDFGSASQGIRIFNDIREFKQSDLTGSNSFCFQKYIDGTEFTVDAYVSQAGEALAVSPRIRVETLGGESVITRTICDDQLRVLSVDVLKKLKLIGPVTLQYIQEKYTGKNFLMEVNTRLGGGVICSIEAGIDIPFLMLNELFGFSNSPVFSHRSILMTRYLSEAFYAVDN